MEIRAAFLRFEQGQQHQAAGTRDCQLTSCYIFAFFSRQKIRPLRHRWKRATRHWGFYVTVTITYSAKTVNERVDRAAEALIADFERLGTHLPRAAVERTIVKRDLSPEETLELQRRLRASGVEIDEGDDEGSTDAAFPEHVETHVSPSDPFSSLLHEPLLSRAEEVELGPRMQIAAAAKVSAGKEDIKEDFRELIARGDNARARMIKSNLRLVISWAKKYNAATSMEVSDLFQEGVIGLMKAAERFDPTLGLKFSTYAVWWIRQSMARALADKDRPVRLPVHRVEQIKRLRRLKRLLTYENSGRAPTLKELSQALDIDLERTAFLEGIDSEHFISTDEPLREEPDLTFGDTLASSDLSPSDLVANAERDELVRRTLGRLAPRDGQVLARRFGIGNSDLDETLQEIGEDLGVTRERIRQIEAKALTRIKPLLEEHDLEGTHVTSERQGDTVKKNDGKGNKRKRSRKLPRS